MDFLECEETYPLPAKWADYKIEAKLGEGSYGQVYRVSDAKGNISALKIINLVPDKTIVTHDDESVEEVRTAYSELFDRYKSEIDCMSALKGVSETVQLLEYETECDPEHLRWKLYIQMEYLTPLTIYRTRHRMEEKDILRLGIDLCSALEACAKKSIQHRDIKPENILVSEDGTFKLGDFGVARQISNQDKVHKARPYVAPEALTAEYDLRADIYSVGLVMYEMLNEMRMPFVDVKKRGPARRGAAEDSFRKRVEEKQPIPEPENGSPEIKAVVLKVLRYDPDERYASATSMKRALLHVLDPDSDSDRCGENLTWSYDGKRLLKISGKGEMYCFVKRNKDGMMIVEESGGPWRHCNFREVQIESGVTSIGAGAFCNRGILSVTIPNSVTSIGAGAFYGCLALGITIPDSVTSIGNKAFYRYGLSVTIRGHVGSFAEDYAKKNHLKFEII